MHTAWLDVNIGSYDVNILDVFPDVDGLLLLGDHVGVGECRPRGEAGVGVDQRCHVLT